MGATLSAQARDGTRTHDLFLTKEVLCRLSYASTRKPGCSTARGIRTPVTAVRGRRPGPLDDSGVFLLSTAGGNRTPNRRFWRPVLYQLSYCRPIRAAQWPG